MNSNPVRCFLFCFREKEDNEKMMKINPHNQPLLSPLNPTPTSTPATTPTPVIPASPPPLVPTSTANQKITKKSTPSSTIVTTTTSTSTTSATASTAKVPPKIVQKFLVLQKPKDQQQVYTTGKTKNKVLNFTLMPNSQQETLKKRTTKDEIEKTENVIKTEPSGIRENNLQYLMIKGK